jgi:hypothetical protein
VIPVRVARISIAAGLLAWCLLVPAAAAGAGPVHAARPLHEALESTRWSLLIAAGVLFVPFAIWRRVAMGKDGRLSTSKTIMSVWTYLVATILLGFTIAELMDHPAAINSLGSGLAGQYAVLIGGPIGAAILAKQIVLSQVRADPTSKAPTANGASAADLVTNDAGEGDIGDLQYVLFNLVAIVFVLGTVIKSPALGLPHIPDVLLGLTSVSAVGFVGKKALPSAVPAIKIDPATAAPNAAVDIKGKDLLVGDTPAAAPVFVFFGFTTATVTGRTSVNGSDTITVTVPAGLPTDRDVSVLVLTAAPALVKAGAFRAL